MTQTHIEGPELYNFDIVGESFYQSNLNRICGGRTEEGHNVSVEASLVCEDSNPHDKYAVRVDVVVTQNGIFTNKVVHLPVGYFPRNAAKKWRKFLGENGLSHPVRCSANIVGGWYRDKNDQGHYGVKLDLDPAFEFNPKLYSITIPEGKEEQNPEGNQPPSPPATQKIKTFFSFFFKLVKWTVITIFVMMAFLIFIGLTVSEEDVARRKAVREAEIAQQIQKLEQEVASVPYSNFEENLRIYKKLRKLNPENARYGKKISHYEKQAKARAAASAAKKRKETKRANEG